MAAPSPFSHLAGGATSFIYFMVGYKLCQRKVTNRNCQPFELWAAGAALRLCSQYRR